MTNLPTIIWLILSGMFFAVGEFLSKSYVLNPRVSVLALLVISYILGVLLWLPALKQQPDLSVTGTLWSVITLLVTVALGVVVFGESLSFSKILGISFAIAAVTLLTRP